MKCLREEHPDKTVEVWAEDEARIGLQPIIRRVWARRGERPLATHRVRYQWLYAYGFVQPVDGKSCWLLLPTVSAAVVSIALRAFAAEVNPQGDKIIVLLVDRAGFHCAGDVEVPPGIVLEFLPPYTPELQPVECTWPLLRETPANREFGSLNDLEEALVQRCRWLIDHPAVIQGAAGFDWICHAVKQH